MNEASAPAGRVVLFGATGYTGDLAARAMVKRGCAPCSQPGAATPSRRSRQSSAGSIGGRRVAEPSSIRALLERGDTWSQRSAPSPAGAKLPSKPRSTRAPTTSTPRASRRSSVGLREAGPRAEASGTVAMTAMGYDWVPGNLTGALALSEAEGAAGVRIGYFATGRGLGGMSGGTRASLMGVLMEPSFQFRDGSLVTERGAKKVHSFGVGERQRQGISVGTSEAFSLPRVYPGLKESRCTSAGSGASRAMQGFSLVGSGVSKIPGFSKATGAAVERFVKTSTGGPDEEARRSGGSLFVAEALDESGDIIATVGTEGISGYEFTGLILAWAAEATAGRAAQAGAGARGPVEAFGLDASRRAAQSAA